MVACLSVFGGMEALPLFPGGVQGRAPGRDRLSATASYHWAMARPIPVRRALVRGDLTVGCVWQSAYPPDGRFTDPRVHRFAPRHRKPTRLVRMARAATPLMLRLRARLFPPEMHEDPAEVL